MFKGGNEEGLGFREEKGHFRGRKQAYSGLLVFLICGNVAGILLLLHLLGGDHCLLVNFTLGHFGSGLDRLLLLLILALLLGAPAGAGVNTGLVVVALPGTCTHGRARVGDPCADAGLLTFQQFPAKSDGREGLEKVWSRVGVGARDEPTCKLQFQYPAPS